MWLMFALLAMVLFLNLQSQMKIHSFTTEGSGVKSEQVSYDGHNFVTERRAYLDLVVNATADAVIVTITDDLGGFPEADDPLEYFGWTDEGGFAPFTFLIDTDGSRIPDEASEWTVHFMLTPFSDVEGRGESVMGKYTFHLE